MNPDEMSDLVLVCDDDPRATLTMYLAETDTVTAPCGCTVSRPEPCVEIHFGWGGQKRAGTVLDVGEMHRLADWAATWKAENPAPTAGQEQER